MMSNDDKFDIVGRITKDRKAKKKKIRERIDTQQGERTAKVTMNKLNEFVRTMRQEAHQEGWHTGHKIGYSDGRRKFFFGGLTIGIFVGAIATTIGWVIS